MSDTYGATALPFFSAPVTDPPRAEGFLREHQQRQGEYESQFQNIMQQRQSAIDEARSALDKTIEDLRTAHTGGAGAVNLPLLALGAGLLQGAPPGARSNFGQELGHGLSAMGQTIRAQRMSDEQYLQGIAGLQRAQAQLRDVPLADAARMAREQAVREQTVAGSLERGLTSPALMKPLPDGMGGFLLPDGRGGFSHLDASGRITPIGGAQSVIGAQPRSPEDVKKAIETLPSDMRPVDGDNRDYSKLAQIHQEDPSTARLIWSMSQGLTNPDEMISMRNSRRELIARKIQEFDPTWSPSIGKLRAKTLADFAPSGAAGKNIISNNTLMEHSGILLEDMRKMHDTGSPLLNKPINWWRANVEGDPTVTDFLNQQQIVATELARQLKGGEPSQAEIEHQLSILNQNSSPAQMQSYVEHIIEDADARKRQVISQAEHTLGRAVSLLPEHMNEKAEKARESVFNNPLPGSVRYKQMKAAKKAAATSSPGDAPPVEGAKKAPDGKWYVQKDGKWFRVGE